MKARSIRRISIAVLCVLLLLGLGGFWYLSATGHRINEQTYKTIQIGMTRAEVEAIFRVPAGSYDNAALLEAPSSKVHPQEWTKSLWTGRRGGCVIWFDNDGKVAEKQFDGIVFFASEPTFLDKIRDWLRL
ncbi:MAG: outer membrane protein assembly factor BamE [Gemmataceae bacterium]|nr:outer membrane protein assembly factor BamE [Gemmataceae bacterium]